MKREDKVMNGKEQTLKMLSESMDKDFHGAPQAAEIKIDGKVAAIVVADPEILELIAEVITRASSLSLMFASRLVDTVVKEVVSEMEGDAK